MWLADEKAAALVFGLARQRRVRPEPAPLDWSSYDIEHRRAGLFYRRAKCLRCGHQAKVCFVATGRDFPTPTWVDLCLECGLWIRSELSVLPAV